jgi:hypothetical protein
MRIAVVTTPPSEPSRVGERVGPWLPHLRERFEIQEFVELDRGGIGWCGEPTEPSHRLRARDFDQILYLLGNEASHAFMLPILRALGGTVVQHDWSLAALATAARPALSHGGMRGALAALREGGLRQARAYRALSLDRAGVGSQLAWEAALGRAELALNRSVVRHADAFVVASEDMKLRILRDRNSATPVGVVKGLDGESGGRNERRESATNDRVDAPAWAEVARQVASCLERFPAPRSRRKSLIQSAIAASRREASGEPV